MRACLVVSLKAVIETEDFWLACVRCLCLVLELRDCASRVGMRSIAELVVACHKILRLISLHSTYQA